MSLWMALFLILSAVAVGFPFLLPRREEVSPSPEEEDGEDSWRRRQLSAAADELDLDLAAGKIDPAAHAEARERIRSQLESPGPRGGRGGRG